jgi:hypothetical protein
MVRFSTLERVPAMKTRIQVLAVETKQGVSRKGGQPYKMDVCKCVVFKEGAQPDVGELVLPKDHPPVTPGMYDGEFGVSVGFDKRISGQLVRLIPVAAAAAKVA